MTLLRCGGNKLLTTITTSFALAFTNDMARGADIHEGTTLITVEAVILYLAIAFWTLCHRC
ncbi:MAG: hypothetical protein SPL96_09865 [Bacteroidales bacterium]|nr:hypothetical protein [Bacteroidales bacterium]